MALKLSDGFVRWQWGLGMLLGYGIAFAGLTVVVKTLPLGLAYGVWSGVGTIGAYVVSIYIFKSQQTAIAWAGVALIVGGVFLLNLGTKIH